MGLLAGGVLLAERSGGVLKAPTERQWWDLEGMHRQAAVTYKGQIKVNRGCGAICHAAINLCAFLHAFQRQDGDLKGRLHLVTLHCSIEAEPLCW